ncbi:ABC transporter substrate-binding protein, partial [Sulfurimonas sp.]|uniref:ABC transporter substrate-binding protein n=1 Tax=Sulfurimonas sp. TaxID=2022749 RepID=UPI0025EF95CC
MKWFIVVVSIVLLIGGCGNTPDKKVFKIGTNLWPGYEALHLAKTEKYFNENIEVNTYESSTIVLNKFRKKEIDAAALTLDEVILLHDQGYTPIIVAVLDISDGADVVIAQNGIKSINELKDKSIGVENTALGSYMLTRVLSKAKLTYKDITLVPLSINRHEDAFKEKVVDSVITFEPVSSKLIKAGGVNIFSSKEIPGEIVDVLVINRDFVNTKFVNDILQGWSKSVLKINKRDKKAISLISKRLNQSEEELIASLETLKIPSLE